MTGVSKLDGQAGPGRLPGASVLPGCFAPRGGPGARYYQPEPGRWTQPDPSGQEANAHLYVGGNPVNLVDPRASTLSLSPGGYRHPPMVDESRGGADLNLRRG